MSEEPQGGEKSHEATPQKIEEARKKGDIPKSQDVSTAASYFGLLLALTFGGVSVLDGFGAASAAFARADALAPRLLSDSGGIVAAAYLADSLVPLALLFAAPFAMVLLVISAQRAFVFAPEKLMFKASRISPLSNAKQKFGISGIVEFSKSTVKLFAISGILLVFLIGRTSDIMGLVRAEPRAATAEMSSLAIDLLWRVALVALVIALIDLVWQRADHARKLRMTYEEVKEEHKRAEGDPMLKSQRRRRAEEIANNRMMQDVPHADVIVVNPTHYAVALQWRRGIDGAPRVVAKGVDQVALRIRETGAASGVPIHSDPPTARALEASIDIGAEVPPEQYQAVAAAIKFAEAMRAKARAAGGLSGSTGGA